MADGVPADPVDPVDHVAPADQMAPAVRVVAGDPTLEELAALLAALAAVGRSRPPPGSAQPPPRPSAWVGSGRPGGAAGWSAPTGSPALRQWPR